MPEPGERQLERPRKRQGFAHADQQEQRDQHVGQIKGQEAHRVGRAPLGLAKELDTEDYDAREARNHRGVNHRGQLDPVAGRDQCVYEHDVERRVDERRQPRDEPHPDGRVQKQRVVDRGIHVIPLGEDVGRVRRLHDSQRGNGVADDAGNERPTEKNDEDVIETAAAKRQVGNSHGQNTRGNPLL